MDNAVQPSQDEACQPSPSSPTRSVRVVVRARPPVGPLELGKRSTLLRTSALSVQLSTGSDGNTGDSSWRTFKFDAVLGPEAGQADVFDAVRMDELARAAASGYNATVFAYGHTGSGKTHTMEGYTYRSVPSSAAPLPAHAASSPSPAAAAAAAAMPWADFDGTSSEQLGLVPRAVAALFAALAQHSAARTARVRVSFIQLYKEQAYDLLNPSSSAGASGAAERKTPMPPMLAGGQGGLDRMPRAARVRASAPCLPLRMRWSKAEEFHLENLFKVECGTASEVMALYRRGVATKVMAAHRMNAASSRSHVLLTLYVDSHPHGCPDDRLSSRLTLVDLAGCERGASIGAAGPGLLQDESVAINRSLFTLRQVILALAAQAGAGAPTAGGSPATQHVPYRDSRLTALLKQALGGNSLTVMVACVACCDAAVEDNLSTLDYAALARQVVNKVAVNEDARSHVIRELRAEVAFLRQQLAAASLPAATMSALLPPQPLQAAPSTRTASPSPAAPGVPLMARSTSSPLPEALLGLRDEIRAELVRAAESDVASLAQRLALCADTLLGLAAAKHDLNAAYRNAVERRDDLANQNNALMVENTRLRDVLLGLGLLPEPGGGAGVMAAAPAAAAAAGPPGAAMAGAAGAAALLELQELRHENALLHALLGAGAGPKSVTRGASWQATASPAATAPICRRSGSLGRASLSTGPGDGRGVKHPAPGALSTAPTMLTAAGLRALLRTASVGSLPGAGNPPASSAAALGVDASAALAHATHQLAAKAVVGVNMLTTTGQVLPGAAAGLAVMSSPQQKGQEAEPKPQRTAGLPEDIALTQTSLMNGGLEAAERLSQLMAARSALTHGRLSAEGTG